MPIDIASGAVHFGNKDISIPGRYPLVWERNYHVRLLSETDTPFGAGWSGPFFAKLTRIGKDYHFRNPDGTVDIFEDPKDTVDRGQVIRNPGSFQEIAKQGPLLKVTRWDVNTGEVISYGFRPDRNGQFWPLRSIEDVTGQGLDLAWDDKGLLKGVRQRLEKRTLVVNHTAEGRLASVAFLLPDGRMQSLAHYQYDAQNRLCAAFDALGNADRFEYDANGRICRELVKDGGVFTYRYDEKGRCIRTFGLDNYDLKIISYLDHIGWREVTNSLGQVRRYQWQAGGEGVLEINPRGGQRTTEYDPLGRVSSETDAVGATFKFTYDESGNRNTVTDPFERKSTFLFNEHHQPIQLLDGAGNVWTREYDAQGRTVGLQEPTGNKWTFTYDDSGNLVIAANSSRSAIRRTFSENGSLKQMIGLDGRATLYDYDEYGRPAWLKLPEGGEIRFVYDLFGNVIETNYSNGLKVSRTYDAVGNLIRISDSSGKTTQYRYGSCRRLLESVNPLGDTLKYHWGTEPDRLEKIINEKGETFLYVYDASNNPILERGFDGAETKYAYDMVGNRISKTNADGETILIKNDALGRVVEEALPNGDVAKYAYDHLNNLILASNAEITVSYVRDEAGRTIKEIQGDYTLEKKHDDLDNLVQLKTNQGHQFDFQYSGIRVSGLSMDGIQALQVDYPETAKSITTFSQGRGGLSRQFTDFGKLLEQVGFEDSSPTRGYRYSPNGVLTEIRDVGTGGVKYAYDAAERLVSATSGNGRTEAFTYDQGENIRTLTADGIRLDLEYSQGQRLSKFGSHRYVHDKHGRLVEKSDAQTGGAWHYRWDAQDRLRSLVTPGGKEWAYGYDALGRRVSKASEGKVTRFVWNGTVPLYEIRDDKVHSAWIFDSASFQPLFKWEDGRRYFAVNDHLGTPLRLVDEDGITAWSAQYRAWGAVSDLEKKPVDCPIRFQGQWYDEESGLHYNNNRFYDPETGRYISPDPIGIFGALNIYAYAPNPVNHIDPLGLSRTMNWFRTLIRAAGVAAILSGDPGGAAAKMAAKDVAAEESTRKREEEQKKVGTRNANRKKTPGGSPPDDEEEEEEDDKPSTPCGGS